MAAAIMTVTTTHTSPICTQTPSLMQPSHQPSATINKPGLPPRSPEAQRRQCTKTTCTPALAHTTSHSRPWDPCKPAVQVLGDVNPIWTWKQAWFLLPSLAEPHHHGQGRQILWLCQMTCA